MNYELENLYMNYVEASITKDIKKRDGIEKKILKNAALEEAIRSRLSDAIDERKSQWKRSIVRVNDFYMWKRGKASLSEPKGESDISSYNIQLKCGENINVYRITDPNVLGRFVGYAKYVNRHGYNVYMRGQTGLYGKTGCYDTAMIPSLYRSLLQSNPPNRDHLVERLAKTMETIRTKSRAMGDYSNIVLEPLLQHYGMKTSMIDLVDNLWIALWFGLYKAKVDIINGTEHVFYVRREPIEWESGTAKREYAYIFMIATDAVEESHVYKRQKSDIKYSGIYEGERTIAVDLRKSLQSRFLRPHAQHGIMIKKKGENFVRMDYSDLIVGIAEIPVDLGQQWIGESSLLNVSTLFPSAVYDSGYKNMLEAVDECGLKPNVKLDGSIQIITG